MLELFPALKRFGSALPRLSTENTGDKPFLRGLANGLMPCGPLQSMQIPALVSESPISGALSILAFSLGTVPFMFGLGALVSALGKRFVRRMTAVGTELIVVMGLVMLSQGGSLSRMIASVHLLWIVFALSVAGITLGIPKRTAVHVVSAAVIIALFFILPNLMGKKQAEKGIAARIVDSVQFVESDLLLGRYPTIAVKSDVPVRWTIRTRGSINGGNYKMIIGEYAQKSMFPVGEPNANFTQYFSGALALSWSTQRTSSSQTLFCMTIIFNVASALSYYNLIVLCILYRRHYFAHNAPRDECFGRKK